MAFLRELPPIAPRPGSRHALRCAQTGSGGKYGAGKFEKKQLSLILLESVDGGTSKHQVSVGTVLVDLAEFAGLIGTDERRFKVECPPSVANRCNGAVPQLHVTISCRNGIDDGPGFVADDDDDDGSAAGWVVPKSKPGDKVDDDGIMEFSARPCPAFPPMHRLPSVFICL